MASPPPKEFNTPKYGCSKFVCACMGRDGFRAGRNHRYLNLNLVYMEMRLTKEIDHPIHSKNI